MIASDAEAKTESRSSILSTGTRSSICIQESIAIFQCVNTVAEAHCAKNLTQGS
jgi:hypothetical protein